MFFNKQFNFYKSKKIYTKYKLNSYSTLAKKQKEKLISACTLSSLVVVDAAHSKVEEKHLFVHSILQMSCLKIVLLFLNLFVHS